LGFTLREIAALFDGRRYSTTMRGLAAAKVHELDALIKRAQTMQTLLERALRCNCLSLDECARRLRTKKVPG